MDRSILYSVTDLIRQRDRLLADAADLRAGAALVSAVRLCEKVQSSTMEPACITMIEDADGKEREAAAIDRQIGTASAALLKKLYRISRPQLRTIMVRRYIQDWPWAQVAADCGYSVQHVFRLRREALEEWDALPECPGTT